MVVARFWYGLRETDVETSDITAQNLNSTGAIFTRGQEFISCCQSPVMIKTSEINIIKKVDSVISVMSCYSARESNNSTEDKSFLVEMETSCSRESSSTLSVSPNPSASPKPATINSNNKWNRMFNNLLKFKEEYGHCLVPNRYVKDPQLGSWVSTQRRQYKMMKLSNLPPMTIERVRRLESIGFVWATRDPRHVPWETRFSQLNEYKKEHGDCLVPIGYQLNTQLSNWVSTQRQEFKLRMHGRSSRITEERIKKLNDIGFVWEAHRGGKGNKRRKKMQNDISCSKKNVNMAEQTPSHSNVEIQETLPAVQPVETVHTTSMIPSFFPSYRQTQYPSHSYFNNDINQASYHAHALNYNTTNKIRKPSFYNHPMPPIIPNQYSKENKNPNSQYPPTQNPQMLINSHGRPIMKRTYESLQSNLNVSTRDATSVTNSVPTVLDNCWYKRLNDLITFRKLHGHCNVPGKYPVDPSLSHWVCTQRLQYQLWRDGDESSMTFPRSEILNALGFSWIDHDSTSKLNHSFALDSKSQEDSERETKGRGDERAAREIALDFSPSQNASTRSHDHNRKETSILAKKLKDSKHCNESSHESSHARECIKDDTREAPSSSSIQAAIALFNLSNSTFLPEKKEEHVSILNISNKPRRYF